MSQENYNHDNPKRKFVRWRAAIMPKHHAQIFEGKIIEANSDSLIFLSDIALKPGSETRLMLEVFEFNGAETIKNQLDLSGKIVDSALIGHISLFRHQIQLQSTNHQQQQLLNKLTQ
ncbi:hypothetical protein [Deefgea rivuli]|uniref:hypothetical protein n=1 Tax=Deefgea rivuli TaxID=400948 RepID=UPI00048783D9|nr:hypothetical protein [Deefgea rivuli]